MDYHVLRKTDSRWLAAATEIYNADWKAAKYLASKMIRDEFDDWEGIVVAEDTDRIVGYS